jgi:hypothetical protein
MVEVEKKIKVHKDAKVFEARSVFDTGSRRSYFSKKFAEKVDMKCKFVNVIGRTVVLLEVEGHILPEEEIIRVIEDLTVGAIIGLNIMESYGIYIENNEIKFKHIPLTLMII